jgi:hypothetical protein
MEEEGLYTFQLLWHAHCSPTPRRTFSVPRLISVGEVENDCILMILDLRYLAWMLVPRYSFINAQFRTYRRPGLVSTPVTLLSLGSTQTHSE